MKNDAVFYNLNKDDVKRITVITGHFGSGKTEFALNYALALKELGLDVIIIDFDIVNPYFRTKDAEQFLLNQKIDVISPEFANLNIENPYLAPEILRAFDDKSKYIVFDVGGDEDGATPLGVYNEHFLKEEYDMFFVLNERRLLTQSVDDALQIYNEIKYVSRLDFTGIVNNTHLMQYTNKEILLEGQKLAEKFSVKTNIPIKFITATPKILAEISEYSDINTYNCFPLRLFVGPGF